MISAECIWIGPAILIVLKDEKYGLMCYEDPKHKDQCVHGFVGNGSIDLTKAQAEKLCAQLSEAIKNYEELDRLCSYHDAHVETDSE